MSPLPIMLPPWPHADTATVSDIGEHGLIRWIRDAVATRPAPADVLIGIGDDAAVVQPRRNHVDVVTTDIQVEDVHFAWHLSTPGEIGARALHVNLSDLASMGAEPRYALLSLGLPPTMSGQRLHALLVGFLEAAARARVAVVGGNISQAPAVTLDVTASGAVKRRAILRRAGARAGDEIYVSGSVGAAAAGLAWLDRHASGDGATVLDDMADAVRRYRTPDARVALGVQVARNRAASACMDTSDGLADALQQMATASGVGMRIEQALVPVSPAVSAACALTGTDRWALALGGGEDYELVFTVPRRVRRAFLHATGRAGLPPVTRIGVCRKEAGVVMIDEAGAEHPMPAGYAHFMTGHATGA
jgi:thiamine-monophosphate kinase